MTPASNNCSPEKPMVLSLAALTCCAPAGSKIYDHSGNLLLGPNTLSSLWIPLGGPCGTNNGGDTIVQYDRFADRWVLTQLGSVSGPYSECIAVSRTNDPTGVYNLYSYYYGSTLNDYPKCGVWPTATNSAYPGAWPTNVSKASTEPIVALTPATGDGNGGMSGPSEPSVMRGLSEPTPVIYTETMEPAPPTHPIVLDPVMGGARKAPVPDRGIERDRLAVENELPVRGAQRPPDSAKACP